MRQVLFRSETLLVWARADRGSSLCVVAFDPMFDEVASLDRQAFGEAFFEACGLDAVHIVPSRNQWYQHPDLPAALDLVRAFTGRYARIATYGSSMGGYAALRFSAWIGANVAVAISPQYSVQPPFGDFDPRWAYPRRTTTWLFETPGETLPPVEAACVFYDDQGLDRPHAEAIGADLPEAKLVRVRHGGHPVGAVLAQTGILAATILDALHGRVDVPSVTASLRQERHRSAQYLFTMARKQPTWRLGLKARLAAQAVAAAPDKSVYLSYAAVVAAARGEMRDSLRLHRLAHDGSPFAPAHIRRATALLRAGETDAACDAAQTAVRLNPSRVVPQVVQLMAHLGPQATDASLSKLLALRRDRSLPDGWLFVLAAVLTRAHRRGFPGGRGLALILLRHVVRRAWFVRKELRLADGEERRTPVATAAAPSWWPVATGFRAFGKR